jgi:hypothetical protein
LPGCPLKLDNTLLVLAFRAIWFLVMRGYSMPLPTRFCQHSLPAPVVTLKNFSRGPKLAPVENHCSKDMNLNLGQ